MLSHNNSLSPQFHQKLAYRQTVPTCCGLQGIAKSTPLGIYVRPAARSRQVYMKWWWKHCLLLSIPPGQRADTYRHKKSFQLSTCLVRIAGPCSAEPFELVPTQLGLFPAGPYQLWCTNLRITTETRSVRNTPYTSPEGQPFQEQREQRIGYSFDPEANQSE
jgi:hypothetical protein